MQVDVRMIKKYSLQGHIYECVKYSPSWDTDYHASGRTYDQEV